MSIDVLLSKLQKVRPNGKSRWMAACPAHEDKTPSLAVQELSDGRILVKCFAGCSGSEIVASVGLRLSDLFPNGAIANELKGWQQLATQQEKTQASKHESATFKDRAILAMCDSARSQGERLSAKDLEIERQAYLRQRNVSRGAGQ